MASIFRVGLITRELRTIEVPADNPDDAIDIALEQLGLDSTSDYTVEFVEEA